MNINACVIKKYFICMVYLRSWKMCVSNFEFVLIIFESSDEKERNIFVLLRILLCGENLGRSWKGMTGKYWLSGKLLKEYFFEICESKQRETKRKQQIFSRLNIVCVLEERGPGKPLSNSECTATISWNQPCLEYQKNVY